MPCRLNIKKRKLKIYSFINSSCALRGFGASTTTMRWNSSFGATTTTMHWKEKLWPNRFWQVQNYSSCQWLNCKTV